jgi:hypothetical protein
MLTRTRIDAATGFRPGGGPVRNSKRMVFHTVRAGAILLVTAGLVSCGDGAGGNTQFQVSFPASLNGAPITGRVFVTLYAKDDVEPRLAAYQSARVRVGRIPFFAADIDQLKPGDWATLDAAAVGYPLWSMRELPAGDYYAQAVLNVLYAVSPRRWAYDLGAPRPLGRPALGLLAGKSREHAGQGASRPRAGIQDPAHLRSQALAGRGAEGHAVGQAHQDSRATP